MKGRVVKILATGALLAFLVWFASHLEFVTETKKLPPKGAAARNPFYAAIKLADELGAEASWEHVFTAPDPDSVIILNNWNWTLSRPRRERLEKWVQSGGRLVIDGSLIAGFDEFQKWSGVSELKPEKKKRKPFSAPDEEDDSDDGDGDGNKPAEEQQVDLNTVFQRRCTALADANRETIKVCDIEHSHSLQSSRPLLWSLREGDKIQALRVAIGKGSLTVLNASPFNYRDFFEGDHPWLFVRLTQLLPGDEIIFLTEEDHASILALTWRFGMPVVLLVAALVVLGLWRTYARFGPLTAPTETARRSLAEQIRGTGHFALRFGGGKALHAASVRALRDAAIRRLPAYDRLSSEERVAALVKATGVASTDLAPALNYSGARSPSELRTAIAVLEHARRRLLILKRSKHGN